MAVMVGREGPLAVIGAALDDALAGAGQLVLITGEPGIGKSLLSDGAAMLAATRGAPLARGYAVDDAGAPPLWPWLRLATQFPTLQLALTQSSPISGREDLDDPRGRFQHFVAVADEINRLADDRGLVVILEDVQWADRTSLLLLRHVYAEMHSSRLLVIATLRDRAHGPVAEVLPDLMRGDRSRVIGLTALSVDDVTAWLRTAPALRSWTSIAADVCQRTGGNPLLIRLLIQALPAEGEPDPAVVDRIVAERADVRGLLTRPLASLGDAARDVLALASVVGERLSVDLLAEVSERAGPRWTCCWTRRWTQRCCVPIATASRLPMRWCGTRSTTSSRPPPELSSTSEWPSPSSRGVATVSPASSPVTGDRLRARRRNGLV